MADDELQNPSKHEFAEGASSANGETEVLQASEPLDDSAENPSPIMGDEPDKEGPELSFPVVGIGGSAGAVEAYISLFEHLPADTGMAFVLTPHLSADQRSYLPEILARHNAMPTIPIENGMQPEPNTVYLLPPSTTVTLSAGRFALERRLSDGAFHPIDYFFQSLASEQKNLAIGVVLSGMDSDGALGLKAIKGEGGISIVQAPESARFPDMPRSSISADHVDIILPPDQIARHLVELSHRARTAEVRALEEGLPPREEEKQVGRIIKLLKLVSGIDFRLYKPTTIRRRIARRMLMHRVDTLAEYANLLQNNPKELRDLHEDILISVTRFFRDPDVFETLKQFVLPHIFDTRSADQQIRIWVAGCSSGEEVYSIVICLLEYLTGSAMEPPIQIFGTDASELSIQKARAGIYPESIAQELTPERLRRFFVKTEKGYQVAKRVRDLCIFARQNLCSDPPFSRLDLISCRNVLIYFGSQLQRKLIPTFHYALRPTGFLLLGTSETIRDFTDLFQMTDRKHKIYSRIGTNINRALMDVAPRVHVADPPREAPPMHLSEKWGELDLRRTADRIVLARYGPPGLIVNENLQIIQSQGHTGPFLELAQGSASLQLARMVRESIAAHVTAAVKRAIDQDVPVQVPNLQVRDGDQVLEITLEVLPMHKIGAASKCYLVLFIPATTSTAPTPEPISARFPANDEDKDRYIGHLQHNLDSTKLYLQSLLEERDAKNQELISANEEIQSANEELQSTNEELETTKEELQSSNEELQTVNDELQNRNAVLTMASNDLSNLLNSVNLPVLMLSNDLSIRHFTPQTQRLMNVRATDIGRPFGDIRLNLKVDNLEPMLKEVLDTLGSREVEVQDREGHWYLLRIRPYRTTDNKIEGLVVVLVDIDQLRRTQQDLRDARDFARSIIESISLPLVVVDSAKRIHSTNEAFCNLTGLSSQTLLTRSLPDLSATLWDMEEPIRTFLERLQSSKSRDSFEFEDRRPANGSRKTFLVRGRVLQPDGEQFVLVTFEDVTAHRDVERLLKEESQRLANQVESTTKELAYSREELRALAGNLFHSQEEERRRLARELHDDISQRLAAANMLGDEVLKNIPANPEVARQKLERTIDLISDLANDVRTLSHRLHPSVIEDLGLAAALRILTEEFGEREKMIATFFNENVPVPIPNEIATSLYRIAQEALRNVAKHAGKTHLKVQLAGVPGGVEMQVIDSGSGFEMGQHGSGLGFISMQERARLIGATVKVHSALRRGTTLTVNVPLPDSR